MFIEKLNQYTEEQIIGLKNEDNKLRLLIEEQPDIEKLKLLKKAIINETTEVTLVMRSNNNNLIAFSYFECISDNIIGVESYNYTENILKTLICLRLGRFSGIILSNTSKGNCKSKFFKFS